MRHIKSISWIYKPERFGCCPDPRLLGCYFLFFFKFNCHLLPHKKPIQKLHWVQQSWGKPSYTKALWFIMKQEADFPNIYLYFEIITLNPLGNESIAASAGFTTFHALVGSSKFWSIVCGFFGFFPINECKLLVLSLQQLWIQSIPSLFPVCSSLFPVSHQFPLQGWEYPPGCLALIYFKCSSKQILNFHSDCSTMQPKTLQTWCYLLFWLDILVA